MRFAFRVSRFRPDLIAALLVLCGLLAFVPALGAFFLADDFVLLSWTRVDTAGEVLGFFDPNIFWFYRPLVKLYYWLGQTVFGLRAAPFHLISLVLHGANAYLLYRLVARLPGALWVTGLAASLLFLLNPRHAETVSWVAATGDLLGLFCILSALLLFRRYWEDGRVLHLAGSLLLFAVGLLSRETVVMLPVLLLLYVFALGRGKGRYTGLPLQLRRFLPAFGTYLAVLATYLLVQALGRGGGEASIERGGLQFRALNLDSILLGMMDYVHGLVPGGNLLAQMPLDVLRVLVWVEMALLALAALALWRAGWRVALFGLAWLTLTPLMFVFFSGPTDRYFYLPSVGYSVLVSALVMGLLRLALRWRLPATPLKVAAAIVLAALLLSQTVALAARAGAWKAAGQATGGVFHDVRQAVPNPGDNATFYFADLPPFLDGVPAFQNALPQMLHLAYDNPTLRAEALSCEELQGVDPPDESYIFQFKGDGARRLPGKEDCR